MKAEIVCPLARAVELAATWAAEHEGYYGTPAGHQRVHTDAPDWMADRFAPAEGVTCGYHRDGEDRHGWVRSSGSWAALTLGDDEAVLVVSGPRHSVREMIPDWAHRCHFRMLSSLRPDLPPWETTT